MPPITLPPAPPRAARRPVSQTWHGVTLVDDYAWLRADNWQEVMQDPAVLAADIRAYLEAENAYTETAMAGTAALQETLFAEMKARIKEDDSTVPQRHGPYAYFVSFVTGGQYPRLSRQPRDGGMESVLLDGNKEAAAKPYWRLGAAAHSPDHALMAYAVDEKGSESFTVRIRDLATGQDLADEILDTRGALVWANDSRTLFYVRLDGNYRPMAVWRHKVGTSTDQDVLVYGEEDTGFFVSVGQTQSSKLITVEASDHQTSEVRLIDADDPAFTPRLMAERQTGHEYSVEHRDDLLIITSNKDGAEDFAILTAPVATPEPANWTPLVEHKAGRLILEVVAFREHLVRLERDEGLPRIVIRRFDDGSEHSIEFKEEAYSLGLSSGYEFDTTLIQFTYSSMTTPSQVYDYDMASRGRVLRKTQEVPSGHDPEAYVTRRLYAPAADGELVPISLLYRKTTPLDGSAPLFLYGYGSYGISMPAAFSTGRLSLVDRGFIFAIAHVRGGKDKGYRWYRLGKHRLKRNTFSDFIAAGEHLVAKGFTRRGRIVANGGSAGGMLMGAVANMAPDLFLGIIANVPFVDVLNTMLDKDLPLTPPEWPEWGNPILSAEDFLTIRSYSPYDNVEAKAYPHIFAHGGLTDPRVTYWEPAKWVARLRERKTDDNVLLLKINMEAGHAGASGRFDHLKEVAQEFAFALSITGVSEV